MARRDRAAGRTGRDGTARGTRGVAVAGPGRPAARPRYPGRPGALRSRAAAGPAIRGYSRRRLSQTRSTCASVSSGNIGRLITSAAARAVSAQAAGPIGVRPR